MSSEELTGRAEALLAKLAVTDEFFADGSNTPTPAATGIYLGSNRLVPRRAPTDGMGN